MAGLFDGLNDITSNPLFLGGAGLALGGGAQGMFQGMQMGNGMRKQRREEEDRLRKAQAYQSLFDDPEAQKQFGPLTPLLRAAGAEAGLPIAGQYMLKKPGEALEQQKHQLDTEYKRAQIRHLNSRSEYIGNRVDPSEDLDRKFYRDETGLLQRRNPVGPIIRNDVRASFSAVPPQSEASPLLQPASDKGKPQTAISVPVPSQNSPMRDWAAWAKAEKQAAETNGPLVRKNAIENKPPQVRDQTLTDEEVQEYYDAKFHGTRGKGQLWRRDGTLQPMVTTQSERLAHQMASDALTELQMARKKLSGTTSLQQLGGAEFDIPYFGKKRPFENFSKGNEDAGIAFRGVSAAVNDLLFAVSGKQVTDKERQHYSDMYMPKSTDTEAQQKWKLDRMERFFTRVTASRKTGATDDDIAQMIRREIEGGKDQETQPNRKASQPPGRNPAYQKYQGLE